MLAQFSDVTAALLARVEKFFASYVYFDNADCAFAAALWAFATHFWPHFDAFPYMVVTSATKQSGKTLFGIDLMNTVAANPVKLSGMTPAVAFRTIDQDKPTLLIDEAETLNSEAASDLRAALNVGYKKGAKFRRAGKGPKGTIEFEVYCPKVFVLIGDVYDTLRDRSIIFRMVRAAPGKLPRRYISHVAEAEGNALRDEMSAIAIDVHENITTAYHTHASLDYLNSRDEEIWLPLFAVCEVLAPSRVKELQRVAVDLATEKTAVKQSFKSLLEAEEITQQHQYAERLLRDLAKVIDGKKSIFTTDALDALKAVPTMPWRKFRGKTRAAIANQHVVHEPNEGLTSIDMANLLSPFGVKPKVIHLNGSRANSKHARGYTREDVLAAVAKLDR